MLLKLSLYPGKKSFLHSLLVCGSLNELSLQNGIILINDFQRTDTVTFYSITVWYD